MALHRRPFLVFSSVGKQSCHPLWMQEVGNFEMALVDYEPAGSCLPDPRIRLWQRCGTKWPNLDFVIEQWPEITQYEAVAVFDDDLRLSGADISRAFELFQQHQLWLGQPSLRLDSHFSWTFTLQRPYLSLRYSGFVENGLTILRGCDLHRLRRAFGLARSGYGLDWALPQLLQAPRGKIAVLDEVACYHPPRVSSLDGRWDRQEQARQGEELCRTLGVESLEPEEYGFVLNASGQAWAAQASPEVVYAAAHRYVLHQMRHEIEKFRPIPGKAQAKSKRPPC
ncbi:hypothetical protein IV102_11325 [bacterium]|nr:hypothetical protein [bacterium]